MTASQVLAATPPAAASRYSLLLTTDDAEVRAAQRLRHRVFAGELGAVLHCPEPGVDVDRFDAFCDHLVVREDATGEIVGTYRMLPPLRAAAAGGLYAEGEFALDALDPLRPSLVETGRSCVHPDHRDGAVINLVWAGIARYMLLTGNRWLIGCASVPLGDGGALAASVAERVRASHLSPERYRVTPRSPWVADVAARRAPLPPLLRGYLRLGAWVCGEPAHDPDFDCADFPVLLGLDHMDPRYARFFLGADHVGADA
ncbi:GNAT family N-acetyltransferase [Pseudonocardia abyssalis]|uniref:GNAT family N-acetyltransferase n=1 Tax=Pseudonocardia abyssalis TaxID=2792008 RepID=A0ABS6UU89_9PSEU|nr:GNAT family N-acyltransferase [Pseudonocardia abyssalis]MBW0117511.1 GNAT family N-acetyltransferase [Pseudonocardia abyssalis]MBW0135792.1 GNAT family N-acetyltransferase [Pseudonocardia abyssalis]